MYIAPDTYFGYREYIGESLVTLRDMYSPGFYVSERFGLLFEYYFIRIATWTHPFEEVVLELL